MLKCFAFRIRKYKKPKIYECTCIKSIKLSEQLVQKYAACNLFLFEIKKKQKRRARLHNQIETRCRHSVAFYS